MSTADARPLDQPRSIDRTISPARRAPQRHDLGSVSALVMLSVGLAAVSLHAESPVARIQPGEQVQPEAPLLTDGVKDHLEPGEGGKIDWTHGYIVAEGRGIARDTSDQQQKMAERAAEVTAARNALALAQGIRIDARGRLSGLKNGPVRLEGVIRGHRVTRLEWIEGTNPPECKAVLKVPLWGVRGLTGLVGTEQRRFLQRRTVRRLALISERRDVSDFVLVIDARGHKLDPCLYPEVIDSQKRVLFDQTVLGDDERGVRAPARYVETDLEFNRLKAAVELGEPVFRLAADDAHGGAADASAPAEAGPSATSQPASQPDEPVKRRAKRRMAVQVAEVAGENRTQLVLTADDAERLRQSADAASAMRQAQVLIVVDAPAAGIEGRGPGVPAYQAAIWRPFRDY